MRVKAFKMSGRYAQEYGFDIKAMRGRDQRASIVAQRRFVAKILREKGLPWNAIAAALCRDHRTVISYFEKTTLSEIALRRQLCAQTPLKKANGGEKMKNSCCKDGVLLAAKNGVKGYFCSQCDTITFQFSADKRAFADALPSSSGKSLLVVNASGIKMAIAGRQLVLSVVAYLPVSAKKAGVPS